MTHTLPGADIRGFYAALGVDLPVRAEAEASIRCFANPGEHRRDDRDPSCSVNVVEGAWYCHGCGAGGGPYDAALARGHSERGAIDLMVAFGITEHDPCRNQDRRRRALGRASSPPRRARSPRTPLGVGERDVLRWQAALHTDLHLIGTLARSRRWQLDTLRELQLGLDRRRITIPIRDADGRLQGLLRYQPNRSSGPKMLAAPGSRLGLIPHPAAEPGEHVLLVEGPPDMITARSCGACAIAVPGDHAWQPSWADALSGRHITIVMDCDPAGRQAAERIARDLCHVATTKVVDLAPERDDGYDLTDWLLEADRSAGRPAIAGAFPTPTPPPDSTEHRHDFT